jgi:hypothetical protein
MLNAARVTLKLHRFEVGAAALAAVAAGIWALLVEVHVRTLGAPAGCLESWIASGPNDGGECGSALREWSEILDAGVIGALAYLPFGVGLLGGIPIVARELESRTAQTAWSLNPSRLRWLVRQLVPIVVLLGSCLSFAAVTTSVLEADRAVVGYSPVQDLGQYGPLIVPRAFGAFGLGLLVGTLLGRTLPALILGVAVIIALTFGVSQARETWLQAVQPVVISETSATGGSTKVPNAVVTAVAYRAPDGKVLRLSEALAVAHAAGAPTPALGDVQDLPALGWLERHGYAELALGVTNEMALGWAPFDALCYGIVGLASLAGAVLIMNQKRPS